MEPANRKSDLRVIKTKRAIHTAFAELLTEYGRYHRNGYRLARDNQP